MYLKKIKYCFDKLVENCFFNIYVVFFLLFNVIY